MKLAELPFNLKLLKLTPDKVRGVKPVTSTDIMGSSGQNLGEIEKLSEKELSWAGNSKLSSNFNEDGLFSVSIFGRIGETERDKRFSYIDIKTKVFHPIIFKAITELKGLYGEILSSKTYVVWNPEIKDFERSDELSGSTGFSFFIKYWDKIEFKRTKSIKRDDKIELIRKFKEEALVDKILVMPAGLRDVRLGSSDRLEFDEINDLYRRVVSISKVMRSGGSSIESAAMDYSRYQLQNTFNEIYNTIKVMLKDKKGFVQNKWAKRRSFNGTRNVISAMDTSKSVLGDVGSHKTTDTIIGLYQMMKGVLPVSINLLRNGYLADIFGLGNLDDETFLVNKQTLKREGVKVNPKTKDRWTTTDGLEKLINSYQDISARHLPLEVEGYYLALIYKGPDKTFKVFNDIDQLPESLDKKYVSPITLTELLYLSGYKKWNRHKAIITRYPVTGLGSTYPTNLFVKTTTVTEVREELDSGWQPSGDKAVAFPRNDVNSFMDSTAVSSVRLGGLGGDYDGDTVSVLIVYSEEAIGEIERKLHSRESYVEASGRLRMSVKFDTLSLVLRNLTGDYPTVSF